MLLICSQPIIIVPCYRRLEIPPSGLEAQFIHRLFMPAFMIEAPEFRGQPSVVNFSDGPVDQLEDPCEQVASMQQCSVFASAYVMRCEILHLWQCSQAQISLDFQ